GGGFLFDVGHKARPGAAFELVQQGSRMFRHCHTSMSAYFNEKSLNILPNAEKWRILGGKDGLPATAWLLGNKKSLLLAIEKEKFSFLDDKIYARGVVLTKNR
ncbi:hypothetical protein, partial [Desulfovibrio piger]|uniref:hypothetical protein n=1 Tax=Desulfovibrio piger TaxID=901 RepID=UPI0026F04D6D